ncbi:MAG: cation diffusion facilitator family transporter [Bacillota bacterium]|nr:cation diffusion facilitator family transporter [Bacillota bacterium]
MIVQPAANEARRTRSVQKTLLVILVLNWAVAGAKLWVGSRTGSASMVADGYHSFSDGASNIIGLVGVTLAAQPRDREHPYGHKKFETLAALGIAVLLLAVLVEIVGNAAGRFLRPVTPEVTVASFAVMLATMAINFAVSRYELRAGRRLASDVLVSDSAHTLSDLFVSTSVLVTLGAARLGLPWVDAAGSLVIAGFIGKAAWDILAHVLRVLGDAAVLRQEELERVILSVEGVHGCREVRSRGRPDDIKVDAVIFLERSLPVEAAHDVAERVEGAIRERFPGVTEVLVHMEPAQRDPDPVVGHLGRG